MAEERHCSQCGAELPADAPQGLCPQCLMKPRLSSDVRADKVRLSESAELDGSKTVCIATAYLLGRNDDRKLTDNRRL
jgi:hypothetical protein